MVPSFYGSHCSDGAASSVLEFHSETRDFLLSFNVPILDANDDEQTQLYNVYLTELLLNEVNDGIH